MKKFNVQAQVEIELRRGTRNFLVPRAVGCDICFEVLGTNWLGWSAQIP